MEFKISQAFKGRDFISIHDYSAEEIAYMIEVGLELKKMQKAGIAHHIYRAKPWA